MLRLGVAPNNYMYTRNCWDCFVFSWPRIVNNHDDVSGSPNSGGTEETKPLNLIWDNWKHESKSPRDLTQVGGLLWAGVFRLDGIQENKNISVAGLGLVALPIKSTRKTLEEYHELESYFRAVIFGRSFVLSTAVLSTESTGINLFGVRLNYGGFLSIGVTTVKSQTIILFYKTSRLV